MEAFPHVSFAARSFDEVFFGTGDGFIVRVERSETSDPGLYAMLGSSVTALTLDQHGVVYVAGDAPAIYRIDSDLVISEFTAAPSGVRLLDVTSGCLVFATDRMLVLTRFHEERIARQWMRDPSVWFGVGYTWLGLVLAVVALRPSRS